jgi:hypothetical protein
MSGLKPGLISDAKATARARAKEEADPCGMTARKAKAKARAIATAIARARARARARANTGVLPLRQTQGQDDGEKQATDGASTPVLGRIVVASAYARLLGERQ